MVNLTSNASDDKENMNYDYASVTKQAGIYAEDGRLTIDVENNAHYNKKETLNWSNKNKGR